MKKRRTIAIVAHDIGPNGGMEKHLLEMVTRLQSDMNVIVVASSMNLGEEQAEGIRFIRIPVIRRPIPLKTILFAIFASIRLLFIKRDILHTTGAIVWNRADVSTVHFCHAGYRKETNNSRVRHAHSLLRKLNSWLDSSLALMMERLIYKPSRTMMLVPLSNRIKNQCLEFFPYKETDMRVIPNGVDLQRFSPHTEAEKMAIRRELNLSETARILLFVGGDWSRKGLEHVIAAFHKVASLYPDLQLVIVGRGSIPHYMAQVEERYKHRVLFTGVQANPEKWFTASDLFVFPTDYETFPLVGLEAAAAGLVILSTRVGGMEDLIVDGENGLFIERDAHDIAVKLDKVLGDWQTYRSLGILARESVQQLTWDETYRQMLRVYDRIHQVDSSRVLNTAVDLRSSADES